MWDEEDGFFYDVLRLPDGRSQRLKVRSMVGLLPQYLGGFFIVLAAREALQEAGLLPAESVKDGSFTVQDGVLVGMRGAGWVALENTVFGLGKAGLLVLLLGHRQIGPVCDQKRQPPVIVNDGRGIRVLVLGVCVAVSPLLPGVDLQVLRCYSADRFGGPSHSAQTRADTGARRRAERRQQLRRLWTAVR